ncbi:MAG: bifunctional metallophosphatase/5'-nucleotidase, partial [Oscillospiraceae bacterium]|nr:bifunctional metallophosphatase/5'-nucleotidase [Oscillospiraceae bacterium]
MKKSRKLLAIVLSLVLVLALAIPAWAYDYEANAKIFYSDFTGKTIILHSNDVHGQLAGYAVMAALKESYEAGGAEVYLVDAGDFSQGSIYVSTSKGASAV